MDGMKWRKRGKWAAIGKGAANGRGLGRRGSAAAVSNLLIEMGLALITEGGRGSPLRGDSRQIVELIEVTAMKIIMPGI